MAAFRQPRSALTVAVLLVAGAACSSGNGDQASTTQATATPPTSPTATTAAPTTTPATNCPAVSFAPDSDNLAADIATTGVDCSTAEKLIRGIDRDRDLAGRTFDGFTCTVTPGPGDVLIHYLYRCTSGSTTVTWTRF